MRPDYIVVEFQFHKVRLKVHELNEAFPSLLEFQFHKVRLKVISPISEVYFVMFQFHKVRLKGAGKQLLRPLTHVSIP